MNKKIALKRILSYVLTTILLISALPGGILASNSINYADISLWEVRTVPTCSTLTGSSGGGVTITQTSTGETNAVDGAYAIDLRNSITDDTNRTKTFMDKGLTGNVTITINYLVNFSEDGVFYNVAIPGYFNARIRNSTFQERNNDKDNNNKQYIKPINEGSANTVAVNINTDEDTVVVCANDSSKYSYSFDSLNAVNGKAPEGSVKYFEVTNYTQIAAGTYLTFNSIYVEGTTTDFSIFNSDTMAILNSLPDSIADDPYNVTYNAEVPDIPNVTWYTSNENVMNTSGVITRTSSSDEKEVIIYAEFDGVTNDGETIKIQKKYYLTVEGLSSRVSVSETFSPVEGATDTTEIWYNQPVNNGIEDGYPILGDPMNLSDELFFGKWDSTSGIWTKQPYLNYSAYSGLSNVEAYVKANDYANAKDALLEYYKNIASERSTGVESISADDIKTNDVLYELLSRNAYAINGTLSYVIDTLELASSRKTYSIDVTSQLKEAAGSFDVFSTMVTSVDKYRFSARIDSRESTNSTYTKPTLRVTYTDGNVVDYIASKDTYIRAGSYASKNFGSGMQLLAEEGGLYSEVGGENNYEDRTKRILIGFDISSITKPQKISKAEMIFSGKHNGSDTSYKKLMALHWYCDGSWVENQLSFDDLDEYNYFTYNDKVCWDYVATVANKEKVCLYFRNNILGCLADMYDYYNELGDPDGDCEKYAYTYIRQQMALINSIDISPEVMSALDMACYINGVSGNILRLTSSEYMTGERFTTILKHLWKMTYYLPYKFYGTKDNNWATYATGGVYAVCARFPELVKSSEWLEETKVENDRLFEGLTFDDGMCLELAQGYQSVLLGTFITPYELKALTGAESPYTKEAEEVIRDIIYSIFNQSAPNFYNFHFGDTVEPFKNYCKSANRWYELPLFPNDQLIKYMATYGSEGETPEKSTTNYPVGLRTFMRSDWSGDALALGITAKMNGSHGHRDALTISMYAYGSYLLTDQGYGGILTDDIYNYMAGPQQHNIVTVNDNTNYLDADSNTITDSDGVKNSYNTIKEREDFGNQLCFDSNDQYDFVEYSTTAYTETELSQRSVMFLKNQKFWIVTDYIIPKDVTTSNVYTQNWHLYPGSDMQISDTKTIKSNFTSEPNVMLVPVGYEDIDEVKTEKTLYSEAPGQLMESQKAVLWKTKAGKTTYSTIILPMDVGEDYTVTSEVLSCSLNTSTDDIANAFSFTVTDQDNNTSNYTYYHLNNETLQTTVTIGDYTTDAQTLLIEEDASGNIVSLYMVNGTFANKGDVSIFKTTKKDTVAFTVENDILTFHTDDDDASVLNNCLINSSLASYVLYKDTLTPFEVNDNGMMYFGGIDIDQPWVMLAEISTDNLVNVTVISTSDDYSASPSLIIAGYNSYGRVCDMNIVNVTNILKDYTYKLNSSAITGKVFLLDSIKTLVPIMDSISLE